LILHGDKKWSQGTIKLIFVNERTNYILKIRFRSPSHPSEDGAETWYLKDVGKIANDKLADSELSLTIVLSIDLGGYGEDEKSFVVRCTRQNKNILSMNRMQLQ
jgi:hypothetical protein